jgi:RNA polymerase sigma-70 factor (ECF subfamily)
MQEEPQHEERTLLAAAQAGDMAALEMLLLKHQAQVYRFGVKLCRDPEDAKDVLQDTMLAVARGIRYYTGAASVSTWLYTIARSFCIKKRRTKIHNAPKEPLVDEGPAVLQDTKATPDEVLASKELEAAIEACVRALPPKYREVLVLRDMEGLSAPEVAEVLGLQVEAVKSRLHRARLMVREQVAPLLGISPNTVRTDNNTCPDIGRMFSKHLEGEISAGLCAKMEKHLQGCRHCSLNCNALKNTLVVCRTVGSTVEVPTAIQVKVRDALRLFLADKPT